MLFRSGLVPVEGGVTLTLADSGAHGDGGSAVSDVVVVPAADPTAHGARSTVAFTVTDLEAGERVIVRSDARVVCRPDARPTGVLQVAVDAASIGATNVPVGRQTVPIKIDASSAPTTSTTTTTTSTTTTTTTTTVPAVAPDSLGNPQGFPDGASAPASVARRATAATARRASCSRGAAVAVAATTSGTLPTEVCGEQVARAALARTGSQGPTILAVFGGILLLLGLVTATGARSAHPGSQRA